KAAPRRRWQWWSTPSSMRSRSTASPTWKCRLLPSGSGARYPKSRPNKSRPNKSRPNKSRPNRSRPNRRKSHMSGHILTAQKGPILEITLNRPEIGNAASDAMAVELTRLLLGAGESAEIVVLRGAGDDFCVGRETMGKRPPGPQPEALNLRKRNDVVFNCYGAFRRCEIPVIGVVRGRAFGFGCAIAA